MKMCLNHSTVGKTKFSFLHESITHQIVDIGEEYKKLLKECKQFLIVKLKRYQRCRHFSLFLFI
jgi:hypothetical protein